MRKAQALDKARTVLANDAEFDNKALIAAAERMYGPYSRRMAGRLRTMLSVVIDRRCRALPALVVEGFSHRNTGVVLRCAEGIYFLQQVCAELVAAFELDKPR